MTPLLKRSVKVRNSNTSISLEPVFFEALQDIAAAQRKSLTEVVNEIADAPKGPNLSSSIRIAVLEHFRGAGTPTAEGLARHG